MNTPFEEYKLPRQIAAVPEAEFLLEKLFLNSAPIVSGSPVSVPKLMLTDALQDALHKARRTGRIVQGIDSAKDVLDRERLGISLLNDQAGQGRRISRLILMSGDGTENFYQQADRLLKKHAPRVLGCKFAMDSRCLGELVFGRGRVAKLVLIAHKDAVSEIFLTMAGGIQ